MLMYQVEKVPDLLFVINAVTDLPCTQYCEWHFMAPEPEYREQSI
jgi:hypothetical protein